MKALFSLLDGYKAFDVKLFFTYKTCMGNKFVRVNAVYSCLSVMHALWAVGFNIQVNEYICFNFLIPEHIL
jgi:hypothetical protein